MTKYAFLLGALIVLTACTSAKPMMVPSGANGYKIWCELPSQCYDRAAKVCPSGYTIEANEKNYLGLGDVDGNLFIVCKTPGATQQAAPTVATAAIPQSAPSAPQSSKVYWVGCVGTMEKAAQQAMLQRFWRSQAAEQCSTGGAEAGLSPDQVAQLATLRDFYRVAISTPAATTYAAFIQQSQKFLATFD